MKFKSLQKFTLLFFLFFQEKLIAQMGINATNTPPAANAMLDISSTTKGLLIPRMTTTQRNALAVSEGLTVYDTDIKSYWFYNGTSWQNMNAAGGGSSKWLSNADDISNINSGNVGIGIATPLSYGHGGINKIFEIKNNTVGSDAQSHIILSTAGTNGSMGGLTWAAPNMPGLEKRAGLIANLFQTTNESRMAFFSRTEAGNLTEKLSIRGNGNVGIGQPDAGFPLNFANTLGDKISLYGNSGGHYGFGIQGALMQIHSDAAVANIAFGHGSSGSFTERMRIINSGADGSLLNGRLLIRNGTADLNNGGGVWLYKADNSALLAFMGTQNNQNVGFYGGPRAWGFTYDGINSRVGIGNNNPNAPLAFGATLEKKITLYPGATGDVGFSVGGNQLKIYADNPNAQVSIGYDAAGVFTDRFSVKANGALALNGNMGVANQVLTSNGANVSPQWKTSASAYNNLYQLFQSNNVDVLPGGPTTDLPGMSQSITVAGNAKIIITFNINTQSVGCFGCGHTRASVYIFRDATYLMSFTEAIPNDNWVTTSGTYIASVGPGTYNFNLKGYNIQGPTVRYWGTNVYSNMTLQVVNE